MIEHQQSGAGVKRPVVRDSMIYTVECSFSDPVSEAQWNDFYSLQKLPALISVTGFKTSQRFRAISPGCPTYLAIHSIDGLAVLQGDEYRHKGGGNFARWQQHITDWHRNLYDGLDRAPDIGQGEYLVTTADSPQSLVAMGLTPHCMQAVALDHVPSMLWLAALRHGAAPQAGDLAKGVRLYAPMTRQLNSAGWPMPASEQHRDA